MPVDPADPSTWVLSLRGMRLLPLRREVPGQGEFPELGFMVAWRDTFQASIVYVGIVGDLETRGLSTFETCEYEDLTAIFASGWVVD